jgi:hypothetical protein
MLNGRSETVRSRVSGFNKERKKEQQRKKDSEREACGNCRSRGNPKRWPTATFSWWISTAAVKKPTPRALRLFHSYHKLDDG